MTRPPLPDDYEDAESEFLTEIWRRLDLAETLSTAADAMRNLEEVARHCEAVVARIRVWLAAQSGSSA